MGSMDSVTVSSGEQQDLESDGFMVLGIWKENLLVPLEFDKIYSMQYFAAYVNKIPWNSLRQVRGECVVFVCPVMFFVSSVWKVCEFWYYGNEQCDCKASLASVFKWCPLLLSRDGGDVGLCWIEWWRSASPALCRDFPESSATFTGWSRGICVPNKSFVGFL